MCDASAALRKWPAFFRLSTALNASFDIRVVQSLDIKTLVLRFFSC
jgi:hypothetical protein